MFSQLGSLANIFTSYAAPGNMFSKQLHFGKVKLDKNKKLAPLAHIQSAQYVNYVQLHATL